MTSAKDPMERAAERIAEEDAPVEIVKRPRSGETVQGKANPRSSRDEMRRGPRPSR